MVRAGFGGHSDQPSLIDLDTKADTIGVTAQNLNVSSPSGIRAGRGPRENQP
jgi:hypothetical protein